MNKITITSYCHEAHRKWIPHWVEQINKQTFKDFYIIFIAHNWKIEESDHDEFKKLDNYRNLVCYDFRSEPVIGEVIDFAASLVDTEFMAHWDLDDIIHPDRLKLQMEHLEADGTVDFIGTRMVGFYGDPDPKMLKLDYYEPDEPNAHVSDHRDIKYCLLTKGQNCLGHTTMIYRPKALQAIGGFSRSDVKLDGKSPDFETWKKAIQAGYQFYRLQHLCALWRLDSSSIRNI